MHTFILLLASNYQARKHMTEAMKRLTQAFPHNIRFSHLHETPAFSQLKDASPYLNAICTGNTALSQEALERWLKKTETEMGRIRSEAAQGRVHIDIDLVVWDDTILRPIDASRPYYQICLKDLY